MSQHLQITLNLRRHGTASWLQVGSALLWLMMGIGSWTWLGPTWVRAMCPNQNRIIDFYQDWGSARNYWSGLPIYAPHSVTIPRHLHLPANPIPSIEYNIHPPTSVLLALPLGLLAYPDAVLVWNVVSLLALVASLGIVASVLPVTPSLLLPGIALLPFCIPVLGNLQMGQITMILSLLVIAIWALERSGRSNCAGLLLGAMATIKLFPLYLAVYYATQRRGRPLLAVLVSTLALTLITVWVLGADSYVDYIRTVLPWNSEFRIFGYNLSIAGFWHKLFHPLNEGERIIPVWRSLIVARVGTILSNLAITIVLIAFTYQVQYADPTRLRLYHDNDSHAPGFTSDVGYIPALTPPADHCPCMPWTRSSIGLDASSFAIHPANHLASPATSYHSVHRWENHYCNHPILSAWSRITQVLCFTWNLCVRPDGSAP